MNLPQTEIPKRTGAAKGAFYEGLLATAVEDGKTFAIFAGDIETLRTMWDRLPLGALDEDEVQRVAMFSRTAVSESRSSLSV